MKDTIEISSLYGVLWRLTVGDAMTVEESKIMIIMPTNSGHFRRKIINLGLRQNSIHVLLCHNHCLLLIMILSDRLWLVSLIATQYIIMTKHYHMGPGVEQLICYLQPPKLLSINTLLYSRDSSLPQLSHICDSVNYII